MDSSKKYVTGYSQFGESRFLSSFSSQSKSDQSGEPTLKKPKLDIAKNGNIPKATSGVSKSVCNRKDAIDDIIWGDESDIAEIVAQVEHEEMILSQMTQTSHQVSTQEGFKKTVPPVMKNSPRVPLRRVGSSQWPSSSTVNSSHWKSNAVSTGKAPANATFLHSDEKLNLELKRIKEELNKKAGEARILRDKVNSSEKEKDKMRREYMIKMDTLKAEAERNNGYLVKEIRSLRGQLDVKNMEIKTAERRLKISSSVNRIQPDSPNRLGPGSRSFQKESSPERELTLSLMSAKAQGLPLKFLLDSVIPELLEPSQPEAPVSESARTSNPRLFSGVLRSEGGSMLKSRCPTIRRELLAPHTSISPCAALLLSRGLVDFTSDCAQRAISQAVDVCHKILRELLMQLESALCSSSRFVERERELLVSGSRQLPLDREYNLISPRELYRDERGILARRALGLMSLLVQASNFTAKTILSSSPKESTEVLDTVRSIVRQVEKQRRTLMFQGVLTGSVALVKSLFKSETAISKETQTLMVDILRLVVAARPGSLVIRNILQTLLAAGRFPHVIDSLCHNSAEKSYKENSRHSIIQFTPDSCVLQVLCGVLKAAETPRKHQLSDLLTLWVLSLFHGGQARPQWLTAAPTAKSCQCLSLVCNLCFSLLSEACFTYPTVSEGDRQLVEKMLARGVLLMNTFMNVEEHLLAIVSPYNLGCYEHFLHFMGDAQITLDTNTRDILAFLFTQEEALRQPGNSANGGQNTPLLTSLSSFIVGDNGKNCPTVLDDLESL